MKPYITAINSVLLVLKLSKVTFWVSTYSIQQAGMKYISFVAFII